MYVCNCNGVSERQVKNAVKNGCSSLRELRDTLGVANNCGQCACHARSLIDEELEARAAKQASNSGVLGYFQPVAV